MTALFGVMLLFWKSVFHGKYVWTVYFLLGLGSGISMLIRPIAIGLGFVLATLLVTTCRSPNLRLRAVLAITLVAGTVVAVVPWQVWLISKTGQVPLLSTGGVPSIRDGLTFGVRKQEYREGVHLPRDVIELMEDLSDR